MTRDKFNFILLLVCFCNKSLSNPVPENVGEVELYSYKGHIDTTTSASDEKLARWTISATLHQMLPNPNADYLITKLSDIKTSLFNGNRSNLHDVHEEDISAEVKILEEPFVYKMDKHHEFSLLVNPNEPLWSINIKRGILNFLDFRYEYPRETADGEIAAQQTPPVFSREETTMYGKCNVEHSRKSASVQDGVVYQTKMDGLKCKQQAIKMSTNTARAPGVQDLSDVLVFNQTKLITLKKRNGRFNMNKLESKTSISYKTSPSAVYVQQVDQEQSITYLKTLLGVEAIDESQLTEKREVTYEFGDDTTRHLPEKDSAKLVKQFIEYYDEFNKKFTFTPVEIDSRSSDLVNDMYNTLSYIDIEGFKSIEKVVGEKADDNDYGYFYLSMLPYIGTNAAVEYLTKFYKSDKINANEGFSARMLTTFPQHIQEPSDDKLVEMEGLMNNPNTESKNLKQAAIFGFASAVATSCREGGISKEYKYKYIDMFHNKYLDGQTYEEKMVYILGLVNMAECFSFDFMNSITTNSSESGELRAFALKGFKKYLQNYENTDKVYETYWPFVQKNSEPLEVRVAALDLLLSCPLSQDQFNSIVQKYSGDLIEPEDNHLANYLLTSLHSLQNTTGYQDHLGELASEALKTTNIQRIPKTFATGFYRLSYTDSVPNFGGAFEARFVSGLETHFLNTLDLSFNSFGNSFDFGTYTIHLKIKGMYNQMFTNKLLSQVYYTPLPQLLKLLKEYDFKIIEFSPEGEIDIVVFVNNVAIYAKHWDDFQKADKMQLVTELDDLLNSKQYASHLSDQVHIPSDIGTPITISNYLVDFSRQQKDVPNNDHVIRYRSAWNYESWVKAYNPLSDASIATYKSYEDEKSMKLNVTVNSRFPIHATWINNNETFTQIWNNNIGTTVLEEKKLKEYCEKCEIHNEIDTNEYISWTNGFEPFGTDFEIEIHSQDEYNFRSNVVEEFWTNNLNRFNIDATPYAAPLLYAANIYNYHFWLRSDLSKGSIRSQSSHGWDETTKTTLYIVDNSYNHNTFKSPSMLDVNANLTVITLEDNVLCFANLTVKYNSDPDYYLEENDTLSYTNVTYSLDFEYVPSNANHSFKLYGHGNKNFPALRTDILSLKPYEDTIGESVFVLARNIDDSAEYVPKFVYTLKDVHSHSKNTIIEDTLPNDYQKCIADSKDLKFTAPTKECKRVSNILTEYDKYEIFLTAVKQAEDRNQTVVDKVPVIEYSRIAEDKIRVDFSGLSNIMMEFVHSEPFSYDIYYPHVTVNPLWLSYNKDEYINPDHGRSTCTITPSTIEKFSGKYVPNEKKEWLAFAECINTTTSGLLGHTIDDKHVGFTFYMDKVVVVATLKNGHLEVTFNGKQITDYYSDDETYIIINIMDENTIYLLSFNLEVYYNTEYIFIRANPQFPKSVCGVCN